MALHWIEEGEGPLVLLLHGFPHAGHWVHWDAADAVNAALLDWLRPGAEPDGAPGAARRPAAL